MDAREFCCWNIILFEFVINEGLLDVASIALVKGCCAFEFDLNWVITLLVTVESREADASFADKDDWLSEVRSVVAGLESGIIPESPLVVGTNVVELLNGSTEESVAIFGACAAEFGSTVSGAAVEGRETVLTGTAGSNFGIITPKDGFVVEGAVTGPGGGRVVLDVGSELPGPVSPGISGIAGVEGTVFGD